MCKVRTFFRNLVAAYRLAKKESKVDPQLKRFHSYLNSSFE